MNSYSDIQANKCHCKNKPVTSPRGLKQGCMNRMTVLAGTNDLDLQLILDQFYLAAIAAGKTSQRG